MYFISTAIEFKKLVHLNYIIFLDNLSMQQREGSTFFLIFLLNYIKTNKSFLINVQEEFPLMHVLFIIVVGHVFDNLRSANQGTDNS